VGVQLTRRRDPDADRPFLQDGGKRSRTAFVVHQEDDGFMWREGRQIAIGGSGLLQRGWLQEDRVSIPAKNAGHGQCGQRDNDDRDRQ
jgi:hypothetical protein